ncbi:MAG: phenylalanine--tRNA ligase subunit alpha [Candidatus Vogelbacteria bacterium CG10_big_fil_rev_8_21_14_0_10_45_14]|uniref:phenylalanine--tRNA ligase n=1 Tax=Candidatus Vogelbacteria bacterium CG10_big_fil_rev_8_21_14_0_10_45_14 TaxID=1975042 RepID=A0A2H0RIP9_9BACT|nr:MAG: phenylalanine--tRNA ligase subunit alpha [Candidatus Vogelbacteria bacterium CG10_big_fil_rev_8_21_14_0_10_45_14]
MVSNMQDNLGHKHPISSVIREMVDIFGELGFAVADGPERETEKYNFDMLNIPADHPARDMWDTFWTRPLEDRLLLRTHTSPVQARYMESNKPPLRIIVPGKVYRYEATDATHEAQFYQLEGLMVDRHVTLANLKGVLKVFFTRLFKTESNVRFRPSYFPFTEPSVEVDVSCFVCSGEKNDCRVCKGVGWIEIMGAGMVQPSVLNRVDIDPREWKGFAFGMGIERIAMLRFGVDDVRLFHSGDLRLVNQF